MFIIYAKYLSIKFNFLGGEGAKENCLEVPTWLRAYNQQSRKSRLSSFAKKLSVNWQSVIRMSWIVSAELCVCVWGGGLGWQDQSKKTIHQSHKTIPLRIDLILQ